MKYSHLWRVRSKGAVLTLIVDFLVFSAFFTLPWLFTEINPHNDTALTLYVPVGVGLLFLAISCPVAGWLADVYFNRYKVQRTGLWFMWAGMLSITATALVVYRFGDCQQCQNYIASAGVMAGVVLFSVGKSAYAVTTVQFGIDQMPEASSDQLSAYIHWFVWVVFAGELAARLTHLIQYCVPLASNTYLLQLMVPMTMLSLALCCDFLLRGWLIIEPGSPNSLKMILQVLRFAVNHKYPIRRRAITYSADERPSRIDFAKDRYGGPYTTEQVEDVKTFFRIAVVLASTSAVNIPTILCIVSLTHFLVFTSNSDFSPVSEHTAYSVSSFAVVIIPLHTVITYSIIKRKIFRMLQRVVISAALMATLSTGLLINNTIEHALNPDISCMFNNSMHMLKPTLWMTIPSNFITALVAALYLIATHEFTCAQSPYSMRGLLFGLMYSIIFFTIAITSGSFMAWKNFTYRVPPSCDFYYFLFQFLCAVVGLTVVIIVAKWYKRRRREEEDNQQYIVEQVYDRLLQVQSD